MEETTATGDWRQRFEHLAGRRRDSWLLVALVCVVILFAFLVWGRPPAARIAPPATASTVGTGAPTPGEELLLVHVAGAVRRPGVYSFPTGARVVDAITAAGGALRSADLSGLNLAELLVDGAKIDVLRKGTDGAPLTAAPTSSPSTFTVNINTADQVALETIPGVGPVTAMAILQQRDAIGSFESFEDLLEVDGIGPATLELIRPYIAL